MVLPGSQPNPGATTFFPEQPAVIPVPQMGGSKDGGGRGGEKEKMEAGARMSMLSIRADSARKSV